MVENLIFMLLFFPLIASLLAFLPSFIERFFSASIAFILSLTSLLIFFTFSTPLTYNIHGNLTLFVALCEALLSGYFFIYSVRSHHLTLIVLSTIQLAITTFFLIHHPSSLILTIDALSTFMFLIIDGVGGIIVLYALRYRNDEETTPLRRRFFTALLFLFIGAMNFLCVSDSLGFYYLFFEITTLCSFLLIGFRRDDISRKNANLALGMNLIGGIMLGVGIILLGYTGTTAFSTLTAYSSFAGLGLVASAALIKGAQFPFNRWLLGAMVAPTPVSALLHSATMVKIAPYTLLKLSPVLSATTLSPFIAFFGVIVFLFAAILSLAQNPFKRLLAYSTIAMLGLMCATAAIGTPLLVWVTLLLMLFHALSKALLFLTAGIAEKVYHVKTLDEMEGLAAKAPLTVMMMSFGFLSIIVPPFGAFIAKWFSLEGVYGIILPLIIALGGTVITFVYLKVVGDLTKSTQLSPITLLPQGYNIPLFLLSGAIVVLALFFAPFSLSLLPLLGPLTLSIDGLTLHVGGVIIPFWLIFSSLLLALALPLALMFPFFTNLKKEKIYICGEVWIPIGNYNFSFIERYEKIFEFIGTLAFISLLGVTLCSLFC